MKKAAFVILATMSLAATSLVAQFQSSIKVDVPFNFVAGGKTLPAGEYTVQWDRMHVVAIKSTDLKSIMAVASHSAEDTAMDGKGALRFNRYGDRYFLSQVWTGGAVGQELAKSRAEREQIASSGASHAVVAITATR